MFSRLRNQFLNVHPVILFYLCMLSFFAMIVRAIFCGGILVGDPFVSRYCVEYKCGIRHFTHKNVEDLGPMLLY